MILVDNNTLGLSCLLGKLHIEKQEIPDNSLEKKQILENRIKKYCSVSKANSTTSLAINMAGRKEQEAAGITNSRNFTLADVAKMQKYYENQYQIVVYNEVSYQSV